eukprot:TRINITY_DN106545_c0_g1_i1.p1 TRINITY_DN106545_c0_g1~~TRINITY_DN106545_c0_g1_i1.p1  ORF type:complete len:270 (-),score=43.80 TRINITY_DN106545_c0_g1_i1:59-823(-)
MAKARTNSRQPARRSPRLLQQQKTDTKREPQRTPKKPRKERAAPKKVKMPRIQKVGKKKPTQPKKPAKKAAKKPQPLGTELDLQNLPDLWKTNGTAKTMHVKLDKEKDAGEYTTVKKLYANALGASNFCRRITKISRVENSKLHKRFLKFHKDHPRHVARLLFHSPRNSTNPKSAAKGIIEKGLLLSKARGGKQLWFTHQRLFYPNTDLYFLCGVLTTKKNAPGQWNNVLTTDEQNAVLPTYLIETQAVTGVVD